MGKHYFGRDGRYVGSEYSTEEVIEGAKVGMSALALVFGGIMILAAIGLVVVVAVFGIKGVLWAIELGWSWSRDAHSITPYRNLNGLITVGGVLAIAVVVVLAVRSRPSRSLFKILRQAIVGIAQWSSRTSLFLAQISLRVFAHMILLISFSLIGMGIFILGYRALGWIFQK